MKAKDVFKELGYEVHDAGFLIIYYINVCPNGENDLTNCLRMTITFDEKKKDVKVDKYFMGDYFPVILSRGEINAIHMQMKELGWLDV